MERYDHMRGYLKIIVMGLLVLLVMLPSGCTKPASETTTEAEESVVLDEGSTSRDPEYFIDDEGRVIYTDSRSTIETGEEEIDGNLAPVFPGSQRIHPAGEDETQRRSYITRARYEAVEYYYNRYLATGITDPEEEAGEAENLVNTIASTGEEGNRQTAIFVNDNDGPRGGMKVMLKEFPQLDMVQIVVTTLEATPMGLNPVGMYITPEEMEELTEEYDRAQEEIERRRQELEETETDVNDGESVDEEGAE